MRCARCSQMVPSEAAFCIYCSAPMSDAATPAPQVQPRPATGPTVRLQPTDVPRAAPRPQRVPVQVVPAKQQVHKHHKKVKKNARQANHSGAVFMIGLAILLFTGNFWPGILALIGVSEFVKHNAKLHTNRGLGHLVFWVGLAVLWNTPFLWPGVLLLMFASHMIGKQRQTSFI